MNSSATLAHLTNRLDKALDAWRNSSDGAELISYAARLEHATNYLRCRVSRESVRKHGSLRGAWYACNGCCSCGEAGCCQRNVCGGKRA